MELINYRAIVYHLISIEIISESFQNQHLRPYTYLLNYRTKVQRIHGIGHIKYRVFHTIKYMPLAYEVIILSFVRPSLRQRFILRLLRLRCAYHICNVECCQKYEHFLFPPMKLYANKLVQFGEVGCKFPTLAIYEKISQKIIRNVVKYKYKL